MQFAQSAHAFPQGKPVYVSHGNLVKKTSGAYKDGIHA